MGIFDIFKKKKNISNDIDDRVNINIANLSGILTGVLTLQITLTKYSNKISKTGKVLNALPKNEFVYGYLYGFIDYNFQTSSMPDEKSWMLGSTLIFTNFYGPKKAGEILAKSQAYMIESKKFMTGVKEGADDAKKWKNKGNPMGLASYIQENLS
tara:strand:+ start:869 stop:1333 length:465 start_codon:yes stop_codon:yes gene_type:complete